jgi:glycosyltransferase involved in cell wall biosynthesis
MRILLVTGSFPPMACGVGDYTASLARALAGLPSVKVAVLTSVGALGGDSGEPFEVFPVIRTWDRDELTTVDDIVRFWKPDIIHIQYPTQGYGIGALPYVLPTALLRHRIPSVQTWHEYFSGVAPRLTWLSFPWPAYALALTRGDVVVVRPDYRKKMSPWFRLLTMQKRFALIPSASALPRVVLTEDERRKLKQRYAPDGRALLVFFGFFFENKGIDDALQIMDVERQRLVMVGEVKEWDPYQKALVERVGRAPFANAVTMTGFLPSIDAARLLAGADAVVLPLRLGAGKWNTSLQAAILQGTFALTTSFERHGYDADQNVYYAHPGDTVDMKQALERYIGRRNPRAEREDLLPTWPEIARQHLTLYERHL